VSPLRFGSIAWWRSKGDHEIRTRDGWECVGDLVRVPGSNAGGAIMRLLFACFVVLKGIEGASDEAKPAGSESPSLPNQ
jgi:hypothetical protein